MQSSAGGRQAPCRQLLGQGRRDPVEDEPERLEILRGGLDREREGQPLRRAPRSERFELLTPRPGVDPGTFLAKPGDQRGSGKLGDGPDLAEAKADEPGPDVGVGGQQPRRMRGEEGGLRVRRDDDGRIRPGMDRGDRGREPGPGNPRPDATAAIAAERAFERPGQPGDQDRLGAPQRLEAVHLDLEQPEGRDRPGRCSRRSPG